MAALGRYPARWDLQDAGIEPADNWQVVQAALRAGRYGDWNELRANLCREASVLRPDNGISSSDLNHMAYAWAMSH